MKPRLTVSRSAVELIKGFEGFRPAAAKLDDGRWTIGYGHTLTAREGAEVSESDAEALLLYDLIQISHAVNEHIYAPLNQNEFDALISFVFNIGVRAFRGSPTLRRLNEGRPLEAALAMEMWRKSDLEGERIVIDALVRRRAAEKALFLKPIAGWTPAPTPVLPPKIDYDLANLAPLTTPVATHTNMDGLRATAQRVAETSYDASEPGAGSPSASEAAAAAVIGRLETLLAEPTDEAPSAGAKAASTVSAEASDETTQRFSTERMRESLPFLAVEMSPRRRGPNILVLLLAAAIGAGLITVGAVWGAQPATDQVFGLAPAVAGLGAGGLGVLLLAVSGYFLLERLGRPRNGAFR